MSLSAFIRVIMACAITITCGVSYIGTAAAADAPSPAAGPTVLWGKAVDGMRLGIAFDKTTYATDEPIVLTVEIENTGRDPREIGWMTDHPTTEFSFNVTGPNPPAADKAATSATPDQKDVPVAYVAKTQWYKATPNDDPTLPRVKPIPLEAWKFVVVPGHTTIKYKFTLNLMYDLDAAPGAYDIRVRRPFANIDSNASLPMIASGTETITITQGPSKYMANAAKIDLADPAYTTLPSEFTTDTAMYIQPYVMAATPGKPLVHK